ncbi:MAG: sigma-54-dependent Fis family transcriptional regulator [Betaproteobacteria bacterium]|nr:sigma-54-dependent Fis family transcriptional regulator [Betaproteobacteria bacterium]
MGDQTNHGPLFGDARAAKAKRRAEPDFSPHLIGQDAKFREALHTIRRLAKYGATVLIQGETGTGKELAARAIHYLSPGEQGPFVPVHCGAIPDELCENEFFGHAKGAYTGAQESKSGILAAAEGGTLFLDEIECLSPRAQAILLRVMQDHVYRPLGSTSLVQGRFRIIAASNRNLGAMMHAGELRQDLFYRLTVLSVTLPSLRQRPSDIPVLARHFIGKFARQYGLPEKAVSPAALTALMRHTWPGNVRELENFIHRQFVMNEGGILEFNESALCDDAQTPLPDSADDGLPITQGVGFRQAKEAAIAEFERRYLIRLMKDCVGNISQAARIAGKERSTLRRLLKKHGIAARDAA